MKIEELSIGDWVLCEGEYWKISAIDEDRIWLCAGIDFSVASLEECDPIPLTPEILEKNGCLHTAENRILCDWFDGRITVRKYNNREWYELFVGSNQMKFKLMFVHQLQHALCLAGIEKKIEL